MTRSKWFVPLLAGVLGLVMFGAHWIGGHPRAGLSSLGIMVVFGALILLGGRSETVRGLRGDGRDERFKQLDLRATAVAGVVVILAMMGAYMVELARGHTATPYAWLGAVAGISYLVAIVVLRMRG